MKPTLVEEIVDEIGRRTEEVEGDEDDFEEGGISGVTISSGGRSVNMTGRQLHEVAYQSSFMAEHPQVERHVDTVYRFIQKLLADFSQSGTDVEHSQKNTIRFVLTDRAGRDHDAAIAISFKTKPAKVED